MQRDVRRASLAKVFDEMWHRFDGVDVILVEHVRLRAVGQPDDDGALGVRVVAGDQIREILLRDTVVEGAMGEVL